MIKKILILLVLFGFTFSKAQNPLIIPVTNPNLSNNNTPNTIGWAFNLAQTKINQGIDVIINLNASSFCQVNTVLNINTTGTGNLTIQKDPTATGSQGITSLSQYGSIGLSSNNVNNTHLIKNITIENFFSSLWYEGRNLTVDNVIFKTDKDGIIIRKQFPYVQNITRNFEIKNSQFISTSSNGLRNAIDILMHVQPAQFNSSFTALVNVNIHNNTIDNGAVFLRDNAHSDNFNMTVNNNVSSSGKAWVCTVLDWISSGSNPKDFIDHKMNLNFHHNSGVNSLSLFDALDYWKVENNNFIEYGLQPQHIWSGAFIGLYNSQASSLASNLSSVPGTHYKMRFIDNNIFSCTGSTGSENNTNTMPVIASNFRSSITAIGNDQPGCEAIELIGLDLPRTVLTNSNVIVRKCKIKSLPIQWATYIINGSYTFNPFIDFLPTSHHFPIYNPNYLAPSMTFANVIGNSLYTSFSYMNNNPVLANDFQNNDLYFDFYKSNATGDLVDYIGEYIIPAGNSTGSGNAIITIPSAVSVGPSEKIAMTLTGIKPVGNTTTRGLGTSRAVYKHIACCTGGFISATGFQVFLPPVVGPFDPIVYTAAACANAPFNITASGCSGVATGFSWNFGDGSPVVTGVNQTHSYQYAGQYTITCTATGPCGPVTNSVVVQVSCCTGEITGDENTGCPDVPTLFGIDCINPNATYNWDFGDGNSETGMPVSHAYSNPGNYNITLTIINPSPFPPVTLNANVNITTCSTLNQCKDCIGSFAPESGEYLVSLWVKEKKAAPPYTYVKTYANTGIKISFTGSPLTFGPFFPDVNKNKIIDGWQRIEEKFTVPATATSIKMELVNNNPSSANPVTNSFYDDIRIHPLKSNMKSYVYDPVTLRLSAELDENNYATFYQYDEEGKLVRIKKETERGIMTIKESRNSIKKK
jgi:PKD repeat protein